MLTHDYFFCASDILIGNKSCGPLLKTMRMSFYKKCSLLGTLILHVMQHTSLFFPLKAAFLSSCFTPLLGFFASSSAGIFLYSIRTLLLFAVTPQIASLWHYLPTLAGILYLTSRSSMVRVGIPLACILLFIAHPVGRESFLYTFYWIPPVIGGFFTIKSAFLRALASTLTTHAVGSTFWIYTHTSIPAYWHALIGVVWAERLLIACIITASYYTITTLHTFWLKKGYKRSLKNGDAYA